MSLFVPLKVETTITVPFGVTAQELVDRSLKPMQESGYEVAYEIKKLSFSKIGKHFDVLLTIGAPLHQVSDLEIELLIHQYCNVWS